MKKLYFFLFKGEMMMINFFFVKGLIKRQEQLLLLN